MHSNPTALINKIFPTNHRLILNRIFSKYVNNMNGKTLVCGAGHNPHFKYIKNQNKFDITTLDIDSKLNVDIICDIHDLKLENETFDNIVCLEVLEHCIYPDKALEEMLRVLKSGGKLFLSTPFIFHIHAAPQDFFRFTGYYFYSRFSKLGETKIINYGNLLHCILDLIFSSFLIFKPFRITSHLLSFYKPYPKNIKFSSGFFVQFTKF